ncbi:12805_t:CDS:2 [Cetraspora pellucida]|uniref:12805_t:CDS:1 n=1 Tax=Cetraspora pellucida TaxID=1433469 RepID=A0A9N9IT78_9GLOM|nr:12805_t:CDS:2 [Cetraspora pellucida]
MPKRNTLTDILEKVENGACTDELKIDVLQAYHTNILFVNTNAKLYSLSDNIHQTLDLVLEDITNALKDFYIYLANLMSVEEFLSISEEDVIYKVFKNDQVIEELVKRFKPVNLASDNSKEEDSVEIFLISINIAIVSLETIFMFLLQ